MVLRNVSTREREVWRGEGGREGEREVEKGRGRWRRGEEGGGGERKVEEGRGEREVEEGRGEREVEDRGRWRREGGRWRGQGGGGER